MPKTFFTRGTPVTAEFLNALNNPQFVGSPNDDGQLPFINDARMDPAPTELLFRANRFINSFEFRSAGGRVLEMWQPRRIRSNGQPVGSGGWTQFNLPASSTGEVWLNWITGTYELAVNPSTNLRPSSHLSLCLWATDANTITSFSPQVGGYRHVDMPSSQTLTLFGGRGLTNGVWSGGQTYGEERYSFNNLTINLSNNILWLPRPTLIQVAGNLVINGTGTINVTPSVSGGGQVVNNANAGAIFYNGATGASNGEASTYSWTSGQPGNAGRSGQGLVGFAFGGSGQGGAGGSALRIQVGGSIIQGGTLTINCNGGAGERPSYAGAYGANHVFSIGGAQGGSGGLLHFQAGNAIRWLGAVTLNVQGGAGGQGRLNHSTAQTWAAVGGSGGGGGWVVEEAPIIEGLPSYQLAGGARGIDDFTTATVNVSGGGNAAGYAGGGGFTFLASATPPIAGDVQLAVAANGDWWYRPASPGQNVRLLRYPIVLG